MSSPSEKQPRLYGLRKSTALRSDPVAQYEAFMDLAIAHLRSHEKLSSAPSSEDEAWARRLLYRELSKYPLRPDIQALIDEASLNPRWVRNHLLTVGTWSERLRRTVRSGLPLRVAAIVARIRRHAADGRRKQYKGAAKDPGSTASQSSELDNMIDDYERQALMPFYEAIADGQQLPLWDPHLNATIRQRVDEILIEMTDGAWGKETAGWISWSGDQKVKSRRTSSKRPLRSTVQIPSVMLYDSLSTEELTGEALHPLIAHKLVSAYMPSESGYVIDPMAGTGTIAHAALKLNHHVWAGDIRPLGPLIVAHDVLNLDRSQLPRTPMADLVVIHPPTFKAWQEQRQEESPPSAYLDFIQQVVNSHSSLVQERGYVLLIIEPFSNPQGDARGALLTSPPMSHHQVVATHTLTSRDGFQVLHVLVFGTSSAN